MSKTKNSPSAAPPASASIAIEPLPAHHHQLQQQHQHFLSLASNTIAVLPSAVATPATPPAAAAIVPPSAAEITILNQLGAHGHVPPLALVICIRLFNGDINPIITQINGLVAIGIT